jgi:hypothetical protein
MYTPAMVVVVVSRMRKMRRFAVEERKPVPGTIKRSRQVFRNAREHLLRSATSIHSFVVRSRVLIVFAVAQWEFIFELN